MSFSNRTSGSNRSSEGDVSQILPELEQLLAQDSFDAEDCIERLTWRTMGTQGDVDNFDPAALHKAFEQAIHHLQGFYEATKQRCSCLEIICREEENRHWQKTKELIEKNKSAFDTFQELDERIDFVATKVVHLGDQLESVNTPRARAVEAQKLMNHFAEFLNPEPVGNGLLNDPSKLHEAADIIQKLHLIAQELPSGKPKFEKARQRIAKKYDEIERTLISKFVEAHQANDRVKMRELAGILSHFKGYSQCVDAYIEQSQMNRFNDQDMFSEIVRLCEKEQTVMTEVFTNSEQVMSKFILNIFHGKLQQYVQSKLTGKSDHEEYLKTFYQLYSSTTRLSIELACFKMGSDSTFLSKLTRNIFARHLDSYVAIETQCLKEKCEVILNRYYNSKNHQKKQIHFGGIHDLRRDIQARIGARTNIIGPLIDNYGGETFLSEEVAMNILQEHKLAFQRCQTLSRPSDLPVNAVQILDILLHYLFVEHIYYALELGLLAIPLAEPKSPPEIYFFDVIRQCNAIYHLFEKKFSDTLIPLVISTPKHGDCLQKKKKAVEEMELKLHTGLERCITSVMGWVKFLLQSEQKKTDFKPDTEMATFDQADRATLACTSVVKFISECVTKMKDSLDGKNVEAVLTELGTRLHKVILDHLLQFQYSSIGAMVVICDLNEYRKCVKEFKVPLLDTLFDTLHALCNLLVVDPVNLKQMCTADQLANLDRSVLMSFVQLRADYKTARLFNQFK